MRAPGAIRLAAPDELLAIADPGGGRPESNAPRLQTSPGEHEKATEFVLVHFADSLNDIGIKRHATWG